MASILSTIQDTGSMIYRGITDALKTRGRMPLAAGSMEIMSAVSMSQMPMASLETKFGRMQAATIATIMLDGATLHVNARVHAEAHAGYSQAEIDRFYLDLVNNNDMTHHLTNSFRSSIVNCYKANNTIINETGYGGDCYGNLSVIGATGCLIKGALLPGVCCCMVGMVCKVVAGHHAIVDGAADFANSRDFVYQQPR